MQAHMYNADINKKIKEIIAEESLGRTSDNYPQPPGVLHTLSTPNLLPIRQVKEKHLLSLAVSYSLILKVLKISTSFPK